MGIGPYKNRAEKAEAGRTPQNNFFITLNEKGGEIMKRSMALNEIKAAGWDGNMEQAAVLAAKHGIGKAAYLKAFFDGQKMKSRGEPRPENMKQ
jgi:hypothetical protein